MFGSRDRHNITEKRKERNYTMAKARKTTNYSINTRIRALTEEKLKDYATSQEMTITDLLNAAVWYCQANNIDLAIWTIQERRKANAGANNQTSI